MSPKPRTGPKPRALSREPRGSRKPRAPSPKPTPTVRLDRALSKLRLASRSEARELIRAGRVAIAGTIVTDPARLVAIGQTIALDGETGTTRAWRTLAFHKPRSVVTTTRDPEGRRTVFDLLGAEAKGLITVGRLDLASTGLLLLTTDTQLANELTDPANAIVRRYIVTARGKVSDDKVTRMEGGIDRLRAERVQVRKRSRRETHLIVDLTEGKNREIRRLFEAIGHEVTKLMRVSFGGIDLGTLQPGEWRELTREDVAAAFGHDT
jgi:23S rRNA pseudouridine2605 synthase